MLFDVKMKLAAMLTAVVLLIGGAVWAGGDSPAAPSTPAQSEPAPYVTGCIAKIVGNDLTLQVRRGHSGIERPVKLSDQTVVILDGARLGTVGDLKPDQWIKVTYVEKRLDEPALNAVRIELAVSPENMDKLVQTANEQAKKAYCQQAGLAVDDDPADFSHPGKPDGVNYENQLEATKTGWRVILTKTLPLHPKPELLIRAEVPLDQTGRLAGEVTFAGTDKPIAPLTITEADNGKTVKAVLWQAIVVNLTGNKPSAGWEVSKPEGNSLKPVKLGGRVGRQDTAALEFTPAKDATNESIGTYTFRYQACREGQTTLNYVYVTPSGPVPQKRDATGLLARMKVTVDVGTVAATEPVGNN